MPTSITTRTICSFWFAACAGSLVTDLADPDGGYSLGASCEFNHECAPGVCYHGECATPEPEDCNGTDDDLDGVVDGSQLGPLSAWCPSRCVAGVKVCEAGHWTECRGSVEPVEEIGTLACDGIDNDCDGKIDDAPETEAYDIVFVIDRSGSMADEVDALADAVADYAESGDRAGVRGAVVEFPVGLHGYALAWDLSRLLTIADVLRTWDADAMSGNEPSYDAVAAILNGSLELNWTPGATRIVLVFTDEQGQSWEGQSELSVCQAVRHGESLVWFTRAQDAGYFDACGQVLELAGAEGRLPELVRDPCGA